MQMPATLPNKKVKWKSGYIPQSKKQGDQIGRVFTVWQFFENYRSSPKCFATFSTVQVMCTF
jgi:hypothetical protein